MKKKDTMQGEKRSEKSICDIFYFGKKEERQITRLLTRIMISLNYQLEIKNTR